MVSNINKCFAIESSKNFPMLYVTEPGHEINLCNVIESQNCGTKRNGSHYLIWNTLKQQMACIKCTKLGAQNMPQNIFLWSLMT